MGYSDLDSSVRVDFFKPNGKWYCTEAMHWTGPYRGLIRDDFSASLKNHLRQSNGYRLAGLVAVCLEPYHEHAFPQMVLLDNAFCSL